MQHPRTAQAAKKAEIYTGLNLPNRRLPMSKKLDDNPPLHSKLVIRLKNSEARGPSKIKIGEVQTSLAARGRSKGKSQDNVDQIASKGKKKSGKIKLAKGDEKPSKALRMLSKESLVSTYLKQRNYLSKAKDKDKSMISNASNSVSEHSRKKSRKPRLETSEMLKPSGGANQRGLREINQNHNMKQQDDLAQQLQNRMMKKEVEKKVSSKNFSSLKKNSKLLKRIEQASKFSTKKTPHELLDLVRRVKERAPGTKKEGNMQHGISEIEIKLNTVKTLEKIASFNLSKGDDKHEKENLTCFENITQQHGFSRAIEHPVDDMVTLSSQKTVRGRKPDVMTIEEELENFNQQAMEEAFANDILQTLISTEEEYRPDPFYLEKNAQLTWEMRSMLIDWIIEVANDYYLKISTCHLAANYIDRFIAIVPDITKSHYQLVGLCAVILACKVEEVYVPGFADFAALAAHQFTLDEIRSMELKIIKALKWRVNPPTLFHWSNWYTLQWDSYIENSIFAKNHTLWKYAPAKQMHFRQANKDTYYRYRELMQLLDCALLDVQTLQYKLRPLVASFMYIILGKDFEQFTLNQIVQTFRSSSLYLLDKTFAFNNLFADFLENFCGLELEDLLPCIQYASTFFCLDISKDYPKIVKANAKAIQDGPFEDFLSYQVHNTVSLNFILKERDRNFV